MDKTKYNRAAKDASQLQQFVDEVCEAVGGNQDSLHVTLKDADGEEAATFDVAYEDSASSVKLTSLIDEDTYVEFDAFGNLDLNYYSAYMQFEPETGTLYVGNSEQKSNYHFMLTNDDGSARYGNVMIAQSEAKEWVLGEQDDQLTLDSCRYQVAKIVLTNIHSNHLSIAFPSETLAVEWNYAINDYVGSFIKDEQSHHFMLTLEPNVEIAQLNYIVVDLTNPLIAHVYAYHEI